MIGLVVALVVLVLAAIPALMYAANLRLYRAPECGTLPQPRSDHGALTQPRSNDHGALTQPRSPISVLIPARNEERSITAAVTSALASEGVTVEVIVLDDHSEDRTAALVTDIRDRDSRVRLVSSQPLPAGWCGKQHACHLLSQEAKYDQLAFLDADVRLAPDGLARLADFQQASGADLVSGIPRQETGSLLEILVIPLIHFVLLGFLPLARMRRSAHPAYGSGCGQLFLARKDAYAEIGGHAAIRSTLHDGIKLPRAFRAKGKMTDLCDATELATCRMYRSSAEVWRGLAKNATEGLASPGMIVPATVLLVGGQVLPFILLACAAWLSPLAIVLACLGVTLAYWPRIVGVWRFGQPVLGAILHPLGVLTLVAIQWYALIRSVIGRPAAWKGRRYQPS